MNKLIIILALLVSSFSMAELPEVEDGKPLPSNIFIELAKKVNPAVVNISTTQLVSPSPQRYRDPSQRFLEEFFGPRFRDLQKQKPAQSLGTGFIIRKDGLIVTNNHVIDQADVIKVQLRENDETLYEATVIGKDARTDIALIKINSKKDLPTIQLGNSDSLRVGEWVAAFGNPYGHGHTMTKGIVSAKGRTIDSLNKFSFIQTDASINPGNSGGPLVNLKGEVVGVNTAIDARAQGIGFAIPVDDVKDIIPILEKKGRIARGFLGVGIADMNENTAESLGLKSTTGALVTQVYEKSPAEQSGVKPYDIFLKFDGKDIESAQDLARAVQDTTAEKSYIAKIERNGKIQELKIKVAENPEDKQLAQTSKTDSLKGIEAPFRMGFKAVDYSQQLANDWGLPMLKISHPIIIDVQPGSPGAMAGLTAGDIILDINRKKIQRAADLTKLLKANSVNYMRILRKNTVALVQIRSGN